jgi:hypothetical protein
MLVTEECKSSLEVLSDMVADVMGSTTTGDVTIGNIRIIGKDVIDHVLVNWIRSEFNLLSFDNELLSDVSGLTDDAIQLMKDYNPNELLSVFYGRELVSSPIVRFNKPMDDIEVDVDGKIGCELMDELASRYVEVDGYGDHFGYDGECTEVGCYYVFKVEPLEDLCIRERATGKLKHIVSCFQ